MNTSSVPVVVLGATGMVGQRMIALLSNHPVFHIAAVAASARSAGKTYAEASNWVLEGNCPADVGQMVVKNCDPKEMPGGVRIALSAMDRAVAGEIESAFADAGYAVVTNAASHRFTENVPLIVPEVNPDHLAMLDRQGPGCIVANPNCCAIPLALTLAPLHKRWGVEAVCVSTFQAVSGAGYPGESAWDMVGSVHPHAGNEEEKLAIEPLKILGSMDQSADFPISARCVRVPVADGHLLGVQVKLKGNPSAAEVLAEFESWQGNGPDLRSCPRPPLAFSQRRDRPSSRHDVQAGGGMTITIGRVEDCPVMGVKYFALGHNTIRGAAGAAIANAELLLVQGRVPHIS
ncbi:MAG: aspartate-semialdehyde dehydrogenase [Deltaproteobacteria bacterium]|nr:aspartate-semialdehyde dehydrogenase [Deltaproteobacteria bacterium]